MIRLIIPVVFVMLVGFGVMIPMVLAVAHRANARSASGVRTREPAQTVSDADLTAMHKGLGRLNEEYLKLEMRSLVVTEVNARQSRAIVDFVEALAAAEESFPGLGLPRAGKTRTAVLARRQQFADRYRLAKNRWDDVAREVIEQPGG